MNVKISLNLFKFMRKPLKCERISPELLDQIIPTIATKRGIRRFYRKANHLPADKTIVSIYHNSKRFFFDGPDTTESYVKSFIGTFVSYTTKKHPEWSPLEEKISDDFLPIDKNILKFLPKHLYA